MKLLALTLAFAFVVDACDDLTLADGSAWHDDGGTDYTCYDHYYKTKRCNKDGGKYSFEGMTANDACCKCGGGSTAASASGGGGTCVVDDSWEHPKYKDTCSDYQPGGSSAKYACEDKQAQAACCVCAPAAAPAGGICSDASMDGAAWHDSGGANYNCEYYGAKDNRCSKDGDKYENGGMTADQACCACGGGVTEGTGGTCMDRTQDNGSPWHDDYVGKSLYDCEYYSKKDRCSKDGNKYANYDMTAQQACCACGGGDKGNTKGGNEEAGEPKPDEGDDIIGEWMGGVLFSHKKHLQDGFILYWNTDTANKRLTFGLLSPAGFSTEGGWLALGLSPMGMMAGSDAVTGWMLDGEPVVEDLYLQNQSPAGIKQEKRQDVSDAALSTWQGRLALVFTRPWASSAGGVEVRASSEFANIIYAHGKTSKKCRLICNHQAYDRYTAVVALTAPKGMSVFDLNKGQRNEPCQGIAALECGDGLSCYHENNFGDPFAPDYNTYGKCLDPSSLGDMSAAAELESQSWEGKQNIFNNDGGYANKQVLKGGFVLLWNINQRSEKGDFARIAALEEAAEKYGDPICHCLQGPNAQCIEAAGNLCSMDFAGTGFCAPCQNGMDPACGAAFAEFIVTVDCEEFNADESTQATAAITGGSSAGDEGDGLLNIEVDTISVALVSTMPDKQGWISFGWSPTGLMKGSDVVIGWSEGSNTYIGDFFLEAQVSSINKPNDKQGIFNERIIKKNGQTALMFERPLMPMDSVQFYKGAMQVIYATGPTPDESDQEFIPYHRYRALEDVAFIPFPKDLGQATAANENELCTAGNQDVICKAGLFCAPLPEELLDSDLLEQFATADMGSFTSNNDFTRDDQAVWSDKANLVGKGICMSPETAMSYQGFDIEKFGQVQTIDTDDYPNTKQLAFGFDLYWKLLDNDRIRIALVSSIGPGWVSLGMGTPGPMIGATAVLGYRAMYQEGNYNVSEYYLKGKLPWHIQPTTNPDYAEWSMEADNLMMKNLGHETAVVFERPLVPSTGVAPIIAGEATTVIWASGPQPHEVDEYFGYHRYRDSGKVTFIPL